MELSKRAKRIAANLTTPAGALTWAAAQLLLARSIEQQAACIELFLAVADVLRETTADG